MTKMGKDMSHAQKLILLDTKLSIIINKTRGLQLQLQYQLVSFSQWVSASDFQSVIISFFTFSLLVLVSQIKSLTGIQSESFICQLK